MDKRIAKIKEEKEAYEKYRLGEGLVQPYELKNNDVDRNKCIISYKQIKNSIPIAYDKKNDKIVYFNEIENNDLIYKTPLRGGDFIPIHNADFTEYIVGRRGCGKSTYVNEFIKYMNKCIDDKLKFVFVSRLETDDSIKLPDNAIRIHPNELITEEYEEGDEEDNELFNSLKNSIIIFDDIHDSKMTDKMKKKLQSFIIDVLENSRHYNIQVMMTSHMICNYRQTRQILNELSNIVVYPQYSTSHQIEYVLKEFFGIKNKLLNKILNNKSSRWLNISSINPKVIISQHEIIPY